MDKHSGEFRIKTMCRVLNASRSGFHVWLKRQAEPCERQQHRAALDARVAQAFVARKGRSGSPTLTHDLHDLWLFYNRKTVAASQRRQNLRAKAAKKFKATTNSKHDLPVAPNLLQQNFTATTTNRKWVGDITYLWTEEGWLCLAAVMDLYSRLVVGWAMAERMTAQLVCDALSMALWRRHRPRGMIVHSDRGSQYCAKVYQDLLQHHDLRCSMSAKGNCYDNAVTESFFHTLKVELIHGEHFATRDQMRQCVFEYIEVDYNRTRRHSANGYIRPAAFEAQQFA